MSSSITFRLPDELTGQLTEVCKQIDRPKSYVIKKALEEYLSEYTDYLVAQARFNDKNEKTFSMEEVRAELGL